MGIRVRLAEHAYAKGLTLRRVAEILEVDYQTVLYWNRGKSLPKMRTLLYLCQLFGCEMEQLIDNRQEWRPAYCCELG